MKKILLLLVSLPLITFAESTSDNRLVSELSINELKQIVRSIVEESIEQCVVTGTMEGRAKVNLKVEGEVIAKYLPAQLSEAEIKDLIAAAIAETGAAGAQQMGLVMKSIQPKIAGRADGGLVSSLVKAALSGGN